MQPLKRINIVTTGAFAVYIAADATDGGAAIVAGNYIGLTVGNKGKLRLKLRVGKERDGKRNGKRGEAGNSGEAAGEGKLQT